MSAGLIPHGNFGVGNPLLKWVEFRFGVLGHTRNVYKPENIVRKGSGTVGNRLAVWGKLSITLPCASRTVITTRMTTSRRNPAGVPVQCRMITPGGVDEAGRKIKIRGKVEGKGKKYRPKPVIEDIHDGTRAIGPTGLRTRET